jgi:DNA topoisomerase VI subunit B
MPLVATPELGIPFPFDTTPEELEDFRENAVALLKTVEELEAHGMHVTISDEDRMASHVALHEQNLPVKERTPGAVKHLNAILSEYDRELLDVHRRLRNYVTNKLIEDSDDQDPRTRLKALELLGKVSGVGLFSDRIDVSVTTRSVKDIENEIRKTLNLYEGEYSEVEPQTKSIAEIDLDAELGTVDGPESST